MTRCIDNCGLVAEVVCQKKRSLQIKRLGNSEAMRLAGPLTVGEWCWNLQEPCGSDLEDRKGPQSKGVWREVQSGGISFKAAGGGEQERDNGLEVAGRSKKTGPVAHDVWEKMAATQECCREFSVLREKPGFPQSQKVKRLVTEECGYRGRSDYRTNLSFELWGLEFE